MEETICSCHSNHSIHSPVWLPFEGLALLHSNSLAYYYFIPIDLLTPPGVHTVLWPVTLISLFGVYKIVRII